MKRELFFIKNKSTKHQTAGFSLVEILVSISIFLIFVIVVTNILINVSNGTQNSANKELATILAEEALEASRNIRDANFINLSDGNHGLSTSSNQWNLSGSSDIIGIFNRTLNISTINPDQKKVDVTISWADQVSKTNSLTLSTYFTNWRAILNTGIGLTVNKTVINHGGSKIAADFAPFTVGTTTITVGTSSIFNEGTYAISEKNDPDYTQTFSGDCNSTGLITIGTSTNNTCLITNEEKPSNLIATNNVINHGLTKTISDFQIKVDTNPVTSGIANVFNSGNHTVSQVADSNYNLTISGDCNGSGLVTLYPNTTKNCLLTNEEKLSFLTVNKTVINHSGTKVAADFAPYKASTSVIILGASTTLNSGTYALSESNNQDYTQTFSGDCNSSGSVTLTPGTTKNCTITNEEKGGDGVIVYGDGTTIPKYRQYDKYTDTFGSQINTITSSSGNSFVIRTSPTKKEAIVGFVTSAGVLNVMCFNGSTWTQEFSKTVGGTGSTRRFDIAYENNSGDAMILYSTNVATTNELAYVTKLGSSGCGTANWTTATNLNPVRTSGIIQWVKMAWDKRAGKDLISTIWADSNSDLSTMIWSGTAWGNEPTTASETSLEVVGNAQDVEDFDVEYESLSGDVMIVWANSVGKRNTNGVRYRTCTGGTATCTWGSVTTPPTFKDDATNLDISANPHSNEIVFASIGNDGSVLQIGYWSGSSWTNTANIDNSCDTPLAGKKLVSTGWLISGATTRSVIRYADKTSTAFDWYVGNGSTFTLQSDLILAPAPISPFGSFDIQTNPLNESELMFMVSDGANNLLAKKLTMTSSGTFTLTNADVTALETTLPQSINNPFSFAFWRH
ncbi:MAG: prepilin-type N-terminal cleavage/methylation domain-containing protein [bacterium]